MHPYKCRISTEFLAHGCVCSGARVPSDIHLLPCLRFHPVDLLLSCRTLQSVYRPPVPSAFGAALLRPYAITSYVLHFLSLRSCSCPEFFPYIYYLPYFHFSMYIVNLDCFDPFARLCPSPTIPIKPSTGLFLTFVTLLYSCLVLNEICTSDNSDPAIPYQTLAAPWYAPAMRYPLLRCFRLPPFPLPIIHAAHSMSFSASDCLRTILYQVPVLFNAALPPSVRSALQLHSCHPLANPPVSYPPVHPASLTHILLAV